MSTALCVGYVLVGLLMWPVCALMLVRSVCGEDADSSDYGIGTALGLVFASIWPLVLPGVVVARFIQNMSETQESEMDRRR